MPSARWDKRLYFQLSFSLVMSRHSAEKSLPRPKAFTWSAICALAMFGLNFLAIVNIYWSGGTLLCFMIASSIIAKFFQVLLLKNPVKLYYCAFFIADFLIPDFFIADFFIPDRFISEFFNANLFNADFFNADIATAKIFHSGFVLWVSGGLAIRLIIAFKLLADVSKASIRHGNPLHVC